MQSNTHTSSSASSQFTQLRAPSWGLTPSQAARSIRQQHGGFGAGGGGLTHRAAACGPPAVGRRRAAALAHHLTSQPTNALDSPAAGSNGAWCLPVPQSVTRPSRQVPHTPLLLLGGSSGEPHAPGAHRQGQVAGPAHLAAPPPPPHTHSPSLVSFSRSRPTAEHPISSVVDGRHSRRPAPLPGTAAARSALKRDVRLDPAWAPWLASSGCRGGPSVASSSSITTRAAEGRTRRTGGSSLAGIMRLRRPAAHAVALLLLSAAACLCNSAGEGSAAPLRAVAAAVRQPHNIYWGGGSGQGEAGRRGRAKRRATQHNSAPWRIMHERCRLICGRARRVGRGGNDGVPFRALAKGLQLVIEHHFRASCCCCHSPALAGCCWLAC